MFNLPLIDEILRCIIKTNKKYLPNDNLNCIVSPTILLVFIVFITTKQQIGTPVGVLLRRGLMDGRIMWKTFVSWGMFIILARINIYL